MITKKTVKIILICVAILGAALIIFQIFKYPYNKNYRLIQKDDGYYIRINKDLEYEWPKNLFITLGDPSVSFESVKDMVLAIKRGDFEDNDLAHMKMCYGEEFKTINLDQLYDVTYPELPDNNSWHFSGVDYYWVGYFGKNRVEFYISTKEGNDLYCSNNPYVPRDYTTTDISHIEDRNATQYCYEKLIVWNSESQELASYKKIVYDIAVGNNSYEVRETYSIKDDTEKLIKIEMIGTSCGQYVHIILNNFSNAERPSVEHLASFGLKEYKP